MRFVLENFSGGNIVMLMRKVGYFLLGEYRENQELNFVNPIGINNYPRFHIYLRVRLVTKELVFNLHLDQKKPVYKKASDHGAEYEGEAIKREAERISQILQ